MMRLKSEDLPTLGRPTMARATPDASVTTCGAGGSRATMASVRASGHGPSVLRRDRKDLSHPQPIKIGLKPLRRGSNQYCRDRGNHRTRPEGARRISINMVDRFR